MARYRGWEPSEADFDEAREFFEAHLVDPLSLMGMFRAAVYSVLTARERTTTVEITHSKLMDSDLVTPRKIAAAKKEDVEKIIGYVTLSRQKIEKVHRLAEWWQDSDVPTSILRDALDTRELEFRLRDELGKRSPYGAPGMAHKCASLFMNMCGYERVVSVDLWALRYL
jgi:endonuclease III